MKLVFLDESGSPLTEYRSYERYLDHLRAAESGHRSRPPPPYFVLAAVGIRENQLQIIDDWFRDMKQGFLGAGPLQTGPQYEIKGSLLYALRRGNEPLEWQGKGRRRPFVKEQKRIWSKLEHYQLEALERSIFDLFRRIVPTIWIIVVNQHRIYKKHKYRTWNPLYWALTYLQQRVALSVQVEHGSYERALLIMDQSSPLAAHSEDFLATRETINETASWPVEFGRYLVDAPVMGQSHLIQALQLADLAAHATWQLVFRDDPLRWFDNLKPFLAKHWQTGRYPNAGLTFIQ